MRHFERVYLNEVPESAINYTWIPWGVAAANLHVVLVFTKACALQILWVSRSSDLRACGVACLRQAGDLLSGEAGGGARRPDLSPSLAVHRSCSNSRYKAVVMSAHISRI